MFTELFKADKSSLGAERRWVGGGYFWAMEARLEAASEMAFDDLNRRAKNVGHHVTLMCCNEQPSRVTTAHFRRQKMNGNVRKSTKINTSRVMIRFLFGNRWRIAAPVFTFPHFLQHTFGWMRHYIHIRCRSRRSLIRNTQFHCLLFASFVIYEYNGRCPE